MNHRKLALAAIAALVFIGPAQGFEFPPQGGNGGGDFRVFCPPGQFWVGLQGSAGDIIDNMKLLCTGFRLEPAAPQRKNWTVVPPVQTIFDQIGESPGGAPILVRCHDNNLVRGIGFNTAFSDGHDTIAFVTMTCDHGTLPGEDVLNFGFNFPVGTVRQFCPERMWATGLTGRRGSRVDAIGLICAEMPPF
jgi:hypothetical protein